MTVKRRAGWMPADVGMTVAIRASSTYGSKSPFGYPKGLDFSYSAFFGNHWPSFAFISPLF